MRHLFLSFSAARNNDKCIRTVRHEWSRCSCIFNKSTTNKDTSLFSLISRSEFNDLVWHRDASTRYIRFQSLRALQSQPLSTKDPPPKKKARASILNRWRTSTERRFSFCATKTERRWKFPLVSHVCVCGRATNTQSHDVHRFSGGNYE